MKITNKTLRILALLNSSENAQRFTLMPFLDIMFAAIGVFIIIFSIQDVFSQKQNRTLQTDILIICKDKEQAIWITKDLQEPVSVNLNKVIQLLNKYISRTQTVPHLLIGLTSDGFQTWEKLNKKLDEITRKDKSQSKKLKANITKTLWPLPDTAEPEKELIQKWQDNKVEFK